MKKIILAGLSFLIVLVSFANNDSSVAEKLQQSFRESFPNAEKVQWSKEPDYYAVSFVNNGVFTRITYNEEGKFNRSVRNYSAESLPYYLVNVVKAKYENQNIFGVTEIATSTTIEYYVKLEGSKFWTTVNLNSDGDSYIVERYRKAK
jgi:hypothetical protein